MQWKPTVKEKEKWKMKWKTAVGEIKKRYYLSADRIPSIFKPMSLLSDSNQRPRDYKSRALASWAKEAKVGKLLSTRRYNLLPLLCSHPGGFKGSWPWKTCPYSIVGKGNELGWMPKPVVAKRIADLIFINVCVILDRIYGWMATRVYSMRRPAESRRAFSCT